ncbi:hypothetical protein [uncultured Tenacibaculum sp.]|uniref:hypothetical protein n=1 Tax=uncultured Tenacibaculum sp. TaxID=174713 RepID=UPI002626964B|nr:hypothetical protein [uncultured Tenacibaculum sp.]
MLEYYNKTYDRLIEMRYQVLSNGYTNFYGVFKRISNGKAPHFKDNLNYLPFTRVKSYYKNSLINNISSNRYQKNCNALIKAYAQLLKTNNKFLNSHTWFSREQLLKNEREIYVFNRDWKPQQWIIKTIKDFNDKFETRFIVTKNSNDIPPYEIPESTLSLTDTVTHNILTFRYGWKSRDVSVIEIIIQKEETITTVEFENPNIKSIIHNLLDTI